MPAVAKLKPNEKALRPVHPNAGIRADYRRRLECLIDEMARSFMYWLKSEYKKNEPEMALDAVPAKELQGAIDELSKRWRGRFRDAAPELARYFAKSASRRSDAALRAILKRAGFSVEFKMTRAMRGVMAATVEQSTQLITSIPEEYLTRVHGAVMRSVQTGRDVGGLAKELQKEFGVTRRRAAFISLDQNNKATSAMQKVRQTELGIEQGIWLHSHAGKVPRPTHLANHGKKFSIADGWFDPDAKVRRYIMPSELPRCRCSWRPIVRGFS